MVNKIWKYPMCIVLCPVKLQTQQIKTVAMRAKNVHANLQTPFDYFA